VAQGDSHLLGPGSVAETTERLASWCKRASRGLARVEFLSESARRQVVSSLLSMLAEAGIRFHEVSVPGARPAGRAVGDLIDHLSALAPGVVSVTGFADSVRTGDEAGPLIAGLNLNRERLGKPALRQIWWLPPELAQRLLRDAPDLNSWFTVRLSLTETVEQERTLQGEAGGTEEMRPSPGDARRRAEDLVARFEAALRSGVPGSEIRDALAIPAVRALQEAGVETEARDLALRLAQQLAQTTPSAPPTPRRDFLISYTSADRNWAEWIAWQLEENGYAAVLDVWDFQPGSNFVLEMQRATETARGTIAVLSPSYLSARFTQPEWAAAFARDPTGEKGTLVPVRVRECDVEGILGQVVYINLVGLDEGTARERLLAGVGSQRAKPAVQPGFPGKAAPAHAHGAPFPGALPAIWNVPHLRNPSFTGRQELIENLHGALASGKPAAVAQAIYGLGGVGKTQVAVEYAYRYASEYERVWWIRAEEPARLAAEYAALAGPLELPQRGSQDQRIAIEAVRRWLEQHRRWLLIFDNAREPAQLSDVLPRGASGHVIITSRNPHWAGIARPLAVQVWQRSESVQFLLSRTRQQDSAAADALAAALGDLPLALEQAAAYMEQTGRSSSEYLTLFQERQAELLSRPGAPARYEATVATTWEISFQEIEKAWPEAADLMNLCAFLAPDDIPRALLTEGSRYLRGRLAAAVGDPIVLDDTIRELRRFSLIEVSADALSIHRLVQAVARSRLPTEARERWARDAVSVLNGFFPHWKEPAMEDDPRIWSRSVRLLTHALTAAGHPEAMRVAPDSTARLLNEVGICLLKLWRLGEAKDAFERAMAVDEAAEPQRPAHLAVTLSHLGTALARLGRLAEARARLERALDINQTLYGWRHPNVAIVRNNLGSVLQDQGDLQGAEDQYRQALEIDEAILGKDHPNVAVRLINMGGLLVVLHRYDQARSCLERAVVINRKAYGQRDPKVGTALDVLGTILVQVNDLHGARKCHEEAIAILTDFYGEGHPAVATAHGNLAEALRRSGDSAGARAHYQQALSIFEERLGIDHRDTVAVRHRLASLLRNQTESQGGP